MKAIEIYGPPLAPPVDYACWTLDRMGVSYTKAPGAAGISAIRSLRNNVPIEPPLILADGTAHGGFRNTLAFLHGSLNAKAPQPQPDPNPALVEMIFKHLFGQAVRCFYRDMLRTPDTLVPMSTQGVPSWHRWAVTYAYPIWARVLTGGLRLDEVAPEKDMSDIELAFSRISDELGDRRFLAGDSPGSDDVFFAAVASPIILPPDHPVEMPDMSALPASFRGKVEAFRDTKAGALALRTYASRQVGTK